jgi:hypothetical protein
LLKSMFTAFLLVSSLLSAPRSFGDSVPDCMGAKNAPLSVINERVLNWKVTKPTQYKDRALVEGTFVEVTLDRDSHYQFSIQIGPDPKKDLLEVIYNKAFGDFPEPYKGMKISACGDFINANKPAAGYPASPAGAIIHWVHVNPGDRDTKHPHGYILMDGVLVGHDYSGEERFKTNFLDTKWFPLNGFVTSTTHQVLRDSETR